MTMPRGAASNAFVLPGGLPAEETLLQIVAFVPITGAVEERLRCMASRRWATARRVTEILGTVVAMGRDADELEDPQQRRPIGREDARNLSVGDRRFLMIQLARKIAGETSWVQPTCTACEQIFDVPVSRKDLPVKRAGSTFPFADVEICGRNVRVRVPNGGDQERVAGLDLAAARSALFEACIVEFNGGPNVLTSWNDHAVSSIEAALDAVAPDVGTTLEVTCPECGHPQFVRLDPYDCGVPKGDALFAEVNALALHYHWSEAEILELPSERRKMYLRLLEASLGLHS